MTIKKFRSLNYLYYQPTINVDYIQTNQLIDVIFKNIAKFFYLTISLFVKSFKSQSIIFDTKNKIIFYSTSNNNYLSLQPVYLKIDPNQSVIATDEIFPKKQLPIFFPFYLSLALSVFYLPKTLFIYYKLNSSEKKRFRQAGKDSFLTIPFYKIVGFWFKHFTPSACIISNDHLYSTRTLIEYGKIYGYKTVYIQHASVAEGFPKLEMDLALLDGEISKNVYLNQKSDSQKIKIVGIPKLDEAFSNINRKVMVEKIGIATNGLEENAEVLKVSKELVVKYPNCIFYYRPHPYQLSKKSILTETNYLIDELRKLNIRISNPLTESVFTFLDKIDCMIAGDSGIHLEAIYLNIYSIYYNFNGSYHDHYNYGKYGMIPIINNSNGLISEINKVFYNRPYVRSRAKPFCDTIDTIYDGKSTEYAIKCVNELLNRN